MAVEYVGSGIDVVFIDAAIKAAAATDGTAELIAPGHVKLTSAAGVESFYGYFTKGSGAMEEYSPAQRGDNDSSGGVSVQSVTVVLQKSSGKYNVAYTASTATATPTPADDGTYTYLWSLGGVSGGLAISAGQGTAVATISGQPNVVGGGTCNVICQVTDSSGHPVSGMAQITIAP